MFILGDARIPDVAKENLARLGTFVPFLTTGVTYESISGHPDIFFCHGDEALVVAPNTPEKYLKILKLQNISFVKGSLPLGKTYPETARYNAVVTDDVLIHNQKYTDPVVKMLAVEKQQIHVGQAYTRCSLLPLSLKRFITSDEGIYKTLLQQDIDVHYFSPQGILLPGFQHGLLGGCCGVFENRIFIIGQLAAYPEGKRLSSLLTGWGYEIVELYEGPLFDGGSLLFFPKQKNI